ncbi:glycosyltransferase family 4 protein [Allorhodopirellula solitaria]|uniref:Mannosylfructose-phosphate synthase n=1 Tax=Allorhodopirellula solitaria TaxID=2527987 RepID=A0A5C5XPA9_9BACT|nr:glycosyltransferase family 4 protein [Allorhodopirellula solitaria]TWT65046.1 Mannosylfructose-phosphate synthase [Allorhodopirellula solitaria]
MKILLIHQAFRTPAEGGGTRHYELLRKLVAEGNQATVIASDVSYLDGARSEGGSVATCDGIEIRRVKQFRNIHKSFFHRLLGFISFMVSAFLAGWKSAKDADVVMGTSPPLFQALSAWGVALLRWKPFLLEIRDLWPDFAIEMGVLRNPVLIFLARRLECFLYARATLILVNSPAFIDYLVEQRGISRDKIRLIPNGVDPAMFHPEARGQDIRQSWGVSDKFVVLYAGAIGPANDLPTYVRAAELLKDNSQVHFILVGDGKDRVRVTGLIEKLGLTNIQWQGVVGKSEMADVLAAADACVAVLQDLPMFKTVYPNKVFDYMAAGRPTILMIDGVIRDVIEDSEGGWFVKPGNPQGLADAVERLANNRAEATEMGGRARDYVTEHFDRSEHAQQFSDLLIKFI